jgi:SAM-dependent methyltransferase
VLRNEAEVEIMASARQPGLRGKDRTIPIEAIMADFDLANRCSGGRILDLGPGHFEFAEFARDAGAREVVGIDIDPAVVRLGEVRGIHTYEMDIRRMSAEALGGPFDGIFCRLSVNALWFGTDEDVHEAWAGALRDLLTPDGWLVIAPWNFRVPETDLEETLTAIRLQTAALMRRGFTVFRLSAESARHLNLIGPQEPAREMLITRNVDVPEDVRVGLITRPDEASFGNWIGSFAIEEQADRDDAPAGTPPVEKTGSGFWLET